MRGVSNTFMKGVCSSHKQQQELARKWSQRDFFKPVPQGSVQWTNLHFVFQAILFCLSQTVLIDLIFLMLSFLCGRSKTALMFL